MQLMYFNQEFGTYIPDVKVTTFASILGSDMEKKKIKQAC
jgi:hypothetical protein